MEQGIAIEGEQVSSPVEVQKQRPGRKPREKSRATELRQHLISWKEYPERCRPSLRALASQLGTSHQLLQHYLDGLEEWEWQESRRNAKQEAKRIRALAKAEGREMTMRELVFALIVPMTLDQLERLRQDARRGPLNWAQIKILKLYAREGYPEAEALLKTCSRLKRKRFEQIVRETPRQEGEEAGDWTRRIWSECDKYGTECPSEGMEELLQKLSQSRTNRRAKPDLDPLKKYAHISGLKSWRRSNSPQTNLPPVSNRVG